MVQNGIGVGGPPGRGVAKSGGMIYRPFGLFRLALALLVILQHIHWVLPLGFEPPLTGTLAVVAFFALSGYILVEAADHHYARRPGAFAINRVLRIVPLYWVALILSMAVHYIVGLRMGDMLADPIFDRSFAQMFALGNIVKNIVSFTVAPQASYLFVPYIWAVRVEFIFYVLLALAIWGGVYLRTRLVWLLSGLAGVALFALFLVVGKPQMFVFTPVFGFGAVTYLAIRDRSWISIVGSLALAILSLYVTAAYVLPQASPKPLSMLEIEGHVAAMALLLAAMPLLAVMQVSAGLRRIDRIAGGMSYPIYVQQYAVIVAVHCFLPRGVGTMLFTLLAIVAVAWLAEHFVDRATAPIRDMVRGRKLDGDDSAKPVLEEATPVPASATAS